MIVRPVRNSDLPALIELARSTSHSPLPQKPDNDRRQEHRASCTANTYANLGSLRHAIVDPGSADTVAFCAVFWASSNVTAS